LTFRALFPERKCRDNPPKIEPLQSFAQALHRHRRRDT
jgi:hypothetical protein